MVLAVGTGFGVSGMGLREINHMSSFLLVGKKRGKKATRNPVMLLLTDIAGRSPVEYLGIGKHPDKLFVLQQVPGVGCQTLQ